MPKLVLIYFDFDGSRGETARIAINLAGIPIEDRRITQKDWPAQRDRMPFQADRKFKPPVQADPCSRNRPEGEPEPTVDRPHPANPATSKPHPTAGRPAGRRHPCPHPEFALPKPLH